MQNEAWTGGAAARRVVEAPLTPAPAQQPHSSSSGAGRATAAARHSHGKARHQGEDERLSHPAAPLCLLALLKLGRRWVRHSIGFGFADSLALLLRHPAITRRAISP